MKRLLTITALSSCLTLGLYAEVPVTTKANTTQTVNQSANVINLAGKQRMLTQKMSKEVLMVAKGINADANAKALKKTVALFDKTLKGLISGDSSLNLPATTDKDILAQLKVVSNLWGPFKASIEKGDLATVASTNIALLKNMNKAVGMFAKASGSKLSPEMAKTINRAGKQRMLTQKMTKELFLIANGIEVEANKKNIKKTANLFETTLNDLIAKCKKDDIKAQLKVVSKLWAEYAPIVKNADTSTEALKKAEKANIPLLKNMNKAVKMYEASAK
jgi:nitrate/nitrite-specific signal transduction histidine kinase